MASSPQALTASFSSRSAADRPPLDRERRAVPESDGLPVASLAARLSEVEDGLHGLPALATRRRVATPERSLGAYGSQGDGEAADAECGDRRQSVDSDVYFGPKAPVGNENNWIQTVTGKQWFTILRLYGALDPWFDKTWRPGEIELVN